MKKSILTVASGSFLALIPASLAAQEVPPASASTETTVTTSQPTLNGQGATILREREVTSTTTTDAAGVATVTSEATTRQGVTTPSGNANSVTRSTDVDGKVLTTVTHEKHATPPKVEKASKPKR